MKPHYINSKATFIIYIFNFNTLFCKKMEDLATLR